MRIFLRERAALILAGFLVLLCPAYSRAGLLEKILYPPHSVVGGISLGHWSSRWWKWANKQPRSQNPVLDKTGQYASVGQGDNSPVWFLAGSYESKPIKRKCDVPEGWMIFLPLINYQGGGCFQVPSMDCQQFRMEARNQFAGIQKLYFTLDGEALKNPEAYYEESPDCFQVVNGSNARGFSSGYWVMLKPLPVGEHVLRFGGVLESGASQNIEYRINVRQRVSFLKPEFTRVQRLQNPGLGLLKNNHLKGVTAPAPSA